MRRLIVIFLVLAASANCHSQKVVFGLQYRPLVPNEVFNGPPLDVSNDTVSGVLNSTLGHSFGALIRRNFTERWSLEVGINQTRRNYRMEGEGIDTAVAASFNVGMISYELPVQALYYVRFTENLYGNALAGMSINLFPTNLSKSSDDFNFLAQAKRKQWVGVSLLANVGMEYRTENSGNFYIGASLHRPLQNIAQMTLSLNITGYKHRVAYNWMDGNFLTVDFRYFFPVK